MRKELNAGISSFVSNLLLALTPAVALFVVIPFSIYLPNQSEFNYSALVLAPYALLGFAWLLCWAILCWLGLGWVPRACRILFWVGLLFLFSDLVAPVQLGPIQGELENPIEPLSLTAAELGLAFGLLLAARFLPAKVVLGFGSTFVAVLIAVQMLHIAPNLSERTHVFAIKEEIQNHEEPDRLSAGGNIYHITFDAYSSTIFEEMLSRTNSREQFDGFVFFPDTRANYFHTFTSTTSFMTGTLYSGGTLRQWRQSYLNDGIIRDVFDRGYAVWSYAYDRGRIHKLSSRIATNVSLIQQYNSRLKIIELADLWLVRSVPNFLQQEVYWDGKGLVSRVYSSLRNAPAPTSTDANPFSSVLLARQIVQDEKSRPDHGQYVYAHLYLPHGPYPMDADCRLVPDSNLRAYFAQAECATRLMTELISELKRLGRYENATIILQSDHGEWHVGHRPGDPLTLMGRQAELLSDNLMRRSPLLLDNMQKSLLVIKPPERIGRPLQVSDRMAQLLDLRVTLQHLLGDEPSPGAEGALPLFAEEFPKHREVHAYLGYKRIDENGQSQQFGPRRIQESYLQHFSVNESMTWTVHPDLLASW